MVGIRSLLGPAASIMLLGAAPSPAFFDLATPFADAALRSADQPMATRVAAARTKIDPMLPGVYPAGIATDQRIARALADLPATHVAYERVIRAFPNALQTAVARFRTTFPDFVSPLPIYLYHSLGIRDGGSDILEPGHRKVMLFGADMIARLHADNSLEPFMDHELFHLEHARYFADCDQFWCAMWQEGLAVSAAALMTPHATDHQLLLDTPIAIRAATDAHWATALCYIAANFDDTRISAVADALMMGTTPPPGLPPRFGYYVGYRVAQEAGRSVTALARLGDTAARPVVRSALARLLVKAGNPCAPPSYNAPITHVAPHPV